MTAFFLAEAALIAYDLALGYEFYACARSAFIIANGSAFVYNNVSSGGRYSYYTLASVVPICSSTYTKFP